MIAIGRYLVFIIYLAGLSISVRGTLIEEDKVKFLNDIVVMHNKHREKHNVEPLERKLDLDSVAAQILNDKLTGEYNQDYDVYGKNYYCNTFKEFDVIHEAKNAYFSWRRNEPFHNYFFEPSDNNTDEFTQLIWKDTKNIGIAARWRGHEDEYEYEVQVVYFPRGNIQEQYRTNVLQRPTIGMTGTTLGERMRFQNNISQFQDYILFLHNVIRFNHGVALLERDKNLDKNARFILKLLQTRRYDFSSMEGHNIIERRYDDRTLLDIAEAETIFLEWKNNGPNYNYSIESTTHEADNFPQFLWNVTQKMGIAIYRGEGFYRVLVLYGFPDDMKDFLLSITRIP